MELEDKYHEAVVAIGQRIKQLRTEQNLTQLDLEVLTGINNGDLSRLENGKVNFEFLTLVKITIALKVEVADLFVTKPKKKGQ